MSERFDWSAGVGRWFGVPVRLHLFFLLAVLAAFIMEWSLVGSAPSMAGTGLAFSLVLLASVLIHELAHLATATNLGGTADTLILVPWGGLSDFQTAPSPGQRFVVHAAGSFANGCLFLLAAALLMQSEPIRLGSLINPFDPPVFRGGDWEVSLLSMVAWINFQLFLVNLIPCFPFDGVQMTRALFHGINAELNASKVESTVLAVGQLTGFVAIGLAWLLRNQDFGPLAPAWGLYLTLGIVLFFCARFEFRRQMRGLLEPDEWDDDDEMDYDSESAYHDDGLNFLTEESYSQWLVEKRQERERTRYEVESEIESEEASRADEILSKLHTGGLASLTTEEKNLLERVSARIRLRRQLGNVD